MPIKIGNIEFFMGPKELNQPDNLEETIISFISGAKKQLFIAVQELSSKQIAQAIIEARRRKVVVKLIMEADYLTVNKSAEDPWQSKGENEENRVIYNALLRAQVSVQTDLNPKIFHQKFALRDTESSSAALLTGSTNFTDTGTHSNLNHIVIIKSKRIAATYLEEFTEMLQGTFGNLRARVDSPPRTYEVSGVPVKVLFAPDHNPEMEIMKQMLKAKKSIDFAIFTFAQSSGIDDTILAIQKSKIPIRGIFDRMQGNQKWAASRILKDKIDVYLTKKYPKLNKLHHKLMILDNQVIIVGSFNYTDPANRLNDENIMIIGDVEKGIKEQAKIAGYASKAVSKIIDDFGEKIKK